MDYPFAFNSGIVKKALGKGFDDFVEKYHGSKARRTYREPTDKQHEMAEYAKKFGTRAAAKKFKVGVPTLNFATYKVGRYYWFNH